MSFSLSLVMRLIVPQVHAGARSGDARSTTSVKTVAAIALSVLCHIVLFLFHRIPDPQPVRTIGARRATCKKPSAFRGTSGHSGSGRGTLALPAMAVPSSIDTGTPAPPDLLPLDPASTHRNSTSFVQESDTRLDLYARSAPTGQLAIE